ncbi:hypothetical protein DDN60_15350 [Vibrio cholerae]|nr:hypothetical protein [Vibrio cholerae]
MSPLIILFIAIVILAALPHVLAKITLDVSEGIKCVVKLIGRFLSVILKGIKIACYAPVLALQDAYKGFVWLKASYFKEYKAEKTRREKDKRFKNALKSRDESRKKQLFNTDSFDGQFFQFNAKLKELTENASNSERPLYLDKIQNAQLDVPTFMRLGIFQTINGELCRDELGNPIKTSVTSLFKKPDVSETPSKISVEPDSTETVLSQVSQLPASLTLVASEPIELEEDGYEPDYDPYLEIA